MSTRDDLIARARTHRSPDASTDQLIRDLVAEITKLLPRPVPVTGAVPGELTREALIAAALAHADDTHTSAYFVTIPNTSPELVVALGRRDHLLNALADQIGTN